MQKLKGQSGETIIETLVSMLIAVICTSMLAAARINEKVRRKLTAELSFRYSEPAVQQTEAVQLTFTDASAESKQVDITLYKSKNDYYWYRSERGRASRTG